MAGAVAAGLIGASLLGSSSTDAAPAAPLTDTPPPGAPASGTAPDFTVELFFDQGSFRLSDHLATDGRPVVLNLWASWCYPCRVEMPELSAVAARHPEVVFLGVAVEDGYSAALTFAEEVRVSYPLGHDSSGQVDAHYAPPGLPATYAIDTQGQLVRVAYGRVTEDQVEALVAELTARRSAP